MAPSPEGICPSCGRSVNDEPVVKPAGPTPGQRWLKGIRIRAVVSLIMGAGTGSVGLIGLYVEWPVLTLCVLLGIGTGLFASGLLTLVLSSGAGKR